VVEHLPSMLQALSSNTTTAKKKKKVFPNPHYILIQEASGRDRAPMVGTKVCKCCGLGARDFCPPTLQPGRLQVTSHPQCPSVYWEL
jgi:hypothetical protein